jgi:hypothetical protein
VSSSSAGNTIATSDITALTRRTLRCGCACATIEWIATNVGIMISGP